MCVEKGVLIMSDEIYEKLIYDGARHTSVASFSPAHYEHTIIVHGLAKAYSMTGWRMGMTAAPSRSPRPLTPSRATARATRPPLPKRGGGRFKWAAGPSARFGWPNSAGAARYAWQKLNSIPGISCLNAKGAFYLFPNISGLGLKSMDFCARLLEEEKVAAVPGIAFGADDYMRISYATSMEKIKAGLDRTSARTSGTTMSDST